MGANQYTPSTERVREDFATRMAPFSDDVRRREFDRWLDRVRAEAKAEALREAAGEFQVNTWASVLTGGIVTRTRNGQEVSDWLRARADRYKEEQ